MNRRSKAKVETVEPASITLQFEVGKDQAIAYMRMIAEIYGFIVTEK